MYEFNSASYNEFIRHYRKQSEKQLIVFAGDFDENRNYAVDQIRRETIGKIVEVDLNEIITPFEEESFKNIDTAIDDIIDDAELVIFRNGGMLNGVYTGFTYSVVKYATPQQKYFLNALNKLKCSALIEFNNTDQLDQMLKRVADVVVTFRAPSSLIEKVVWWAKSIRVNGSILPSPRPRTDN
ncbi:hypothetical protein AB2B38_001515 [Balneola sp. MJW-20]|uniref:hypothetical protein n=1 Tax=Gracilimonas aurantiaca TaxID=3234185 RepID=UPI0034666979